MDYRIAVVIQPKNTTDLAGTLIFGEKIKDIGVVLCMVTPEHDILPFGDNDQSEIDKRINNIITEGDLTPEENEHIHNTPDIPNFDLSGYPSIMIIKKGGESFVQNDIEKYVDTFNNIIEDVEPYVLHTKYKGVDRIQIPYMTDEVVFWRYKEDIYGENKYHSLEEQIRYLLDCICQEYSNDTERFINIVNKFYACGCDPKIQSWHKSNLDMINRDDKLIRLFGELSERRNNIENIEEVLNRLSDDITDGCYIQKMELYKNNDGFVNIKIYSNFKFPRVRGIVLGYDGSNICAARFDCTSSNGIPLYVQVDTWIGNKDNPPIIIAPETSDYTMTIDSRQKFYFITDIPECVYEVLDEYRLNLQEVQSVPLSTAYNGDFIKNVKDNYIYNIGKDTVVAHKISVVGDLEEDYQESYIENYRVNHILPQIINDIDDEYMCIIGDVKDINPDQRINFKIYDEYDNSRVIMDRTIKYSEYISMSGGLPFIYPKVYENGVDYTVETKFVKANGDTIPNTEVYRLRTSVPRSDKAAIITDDFEYTKNEIHIKKVNNTMYAVGTVLKIRIYNAYGDIYNNIIKIDNDMFNKGYVIVELSNALSDKATIEIEVKEENKFQTIKQSFDIDMNSILPHSYFEISDINIWNKRFYINRNILNTQLNQDNTFFSSMWYTDINKVYSEYPNDFGLNLKSGAPKIEITTKIKGHPLLEGFAWKTIFTRDINEINVNGITTNNIPISSIEVNNIPYNLYYDKFLRENDFDQNGINDFRALCNDLIVPYGGMYEFTIKTYDIFGSEKNAVNYTVDTIINNKIISNTLDTNNIFDTLFEYESTEDNMICKMKLNVGYKYKDAEFILMIDNDDNRPSNNTKLYNFYINDQGNITQTSDINYDSLVRDKSSYVIYKKEDLQTVVSKQNIILWIRPRNKNNAIFNEWYSGSSINNTYYRIEKNISRPVPKEIGFITMTSSVNLPAFIDYIDDEYIKTKFSHNIPDKDLDKYTCKLEIFDKDTNKSIDFVESDMNAWQTKDNRHVFEKLKFEKDINKYKIVGTINKIGDSSYNTSNRIRENEVVVKRTVQPWFDKDSLLNNAYNTVDIRMADGKSYPINTKFWLRIENDDEENIVFEYNGTVSVEDIYKGYHHIYINKPLTGIYTISVIAKEPDKYQSIIYRSSVNFINSKFKYGIIYHDNDKELSNFRYEPNSAIDSNLIKYINRLVKRRFPGRNILKAEILKGDTVIESVDDINNLIDKLTNDDMNIRLYLEIIPEGEIRYITMYINGIESGICVVKNGIMEYNDWIEEYSQIYDKTSLITNAIEITEKSNGSDDIINTYLNIKSITKLLDMHKIKIGRLNNIEVRSLYTNIKFKISDKTHGDFTDQAKRFPEYDADNDVFNYKIDNLDVYPDNTLEKIVSYIKSITRTDNKYDIYSISVDGKEIWNFDNTHNKQIWKTVIRNNVMFNIEISNINGVLFNIIINDSINNDYNYNVNIKTKIGSKLYESKLNHIMHYVENKYTNKGSGISMITKNPTDDYKIEMFYKKDDDTYDIISNDYVLDSVFNRCSDHTIEKNRQVYYPNKPAIDGFIVNKDEYTFRFNISLADNDTGIKDKNLRHHTIIKIKMVNGKMKSSNFPNAKAYNTITKKLLNNTEEVDEVYLFIPNNSSVSGMFIISDSVVSNEFDINNIVATYNGKQYTSESGEFSPFYHTPITYINNNINNLIISFGKKKAGDVYVTKIEAVREMRELPRFYNHENNHEYSNIIYPIEVIDGSKSTRDKIANIILNTPSLLSALGNIQSSAIYNKTKYLTKDNIWSVLEYPTICPANINLKIDVYFNKPYRDSVYKSGIGIANAANIIADTVFNTMQNYFNSVVYSNLYPGITNLAARVPIICDKAGIFNNSFDNAIEIDDKHLRVSKILFTTNVDNISDNNITNAEYATLADYIVAYNIVHSDISSRNIYLSESTNIFGDITRKSLAIKNSLISTNNSYTHYDYRKVIGNSIEFYRIFEQAMQIRKRIQWHPLNYYIAVSGGDFEEYRVMDRTYKPIGSTLGISNDFILIDNKKYILKLDDPYNNGDILDLNTMMQTMNNDPKYYKHIDNTILEYHNTRNIYKRNIVDEAYSPFKEVSGLVAEPILWSTDVDRTYAFNNVIYSKKIGDDRDTNYIDSSYNSSYLTHYAIEDNYRLDIGVSIPTMRPIGILATDLPHSKNEFGLCQNTIENQPNIMSNSILFWVEHKDHSSSTQPAQNTSDVTEKSADNLELVVRVEDIYTDEDIIDVSAYDYNIHHVEIPRIPYDNFAINIVLKSSDSEKYLEDKYLDITGICKIELIPRKISDIVIEESVLNANMNIPSDSIIALTNEQMSKMKLDYEYKYDQYVGISGKVEIDQSITLKNDKVNAIKDKCSKGMMNVIRLIQNNEYIYKSTLLVFEVRLSVICSAGRVLNQFKYYMIYNYKKDTESYPIGAESNADGSWDNNYSFRSDMPEEIDIFSGKFPIKNLFTRNIDYPIDKIFKYKTDINTFTIKLKKFKVNNMYQYLPIELVGYNLDKYGNKYPVISEVKYDPNINSYHLEYGYGNEFPWNKENELFDIDELNKNINNRHGFAIMINLPLVDKDKAKYTRSWYRRFGYLLKAPDGSYILDSSFALHRIPTVDSSTNDPLANSDIHTKNLVINNVISYMNELLQSESRAEQKMSGYLLGKVPYDLYSLNRMIYSISDITKVKYCAPYVNYVVFSNMVLALYIYELCGFFKNTDYDRVRKSVEYWTSQAFALLSDSGVHNVENNKTSYDGLKMINITKYGWIRTFIRNIFKNFIDTYNVYVSPVKNRDAHLEPSDIFNKDSNLPYIRAASLLGNNDDYEKIDLDKLISEEALDTGIMPNKTKEIALIADLDTMSNPSPNKPTIIAKTKKGNLIKVLLEIDASTYVYHCVDYIKPSLVTITQPITKFLERYTTIIEVELPNNGSELAIGSWLDGYDLSRPTYIKLTDNDFISENNFNDLVTSKKAIPNVVIGWYKPGVDDHFSRYDKNPKKSGLYLKTDTLLTKYDNDKYDHTSLEFYYPLFRTIGENVNRKLDVLYKNEVLHARTSDSREIVLINGASFYPNPLLDYVLTILDNKNPSRILRLY